MPPQTFYSRHGKRALDLALAAILLLLALTPGLLVAVAIFCLCGRPVLYFQTRIGLRGNPFTIYKFRTMRSGSERAGPVTVAGDARLTKLGGFLRRYKLDELPQLWNVLRGEMSMVGPRPEVPEYAGLLHSQHAAILAVRPGITGPATLAYAREEEELARQRDPAAYNRDVIFPRKIELNRHYVNRITLRGDLRCLLETAFACLRKPAASNAGQPARTHILLSVPHMGGAEQDYVREAFDTNWLSTAGPNLAAFEDAFSARIGLPAIALSSGTAALHLAIRLARITTGDEVFCSTLTFAAAANAIRYQGGVPVFLDSDRATWNLDPHLLAGVLRQRAAVNRLPKALIVVHLYGQSADMDPILGLCARYGITVIEDAAEAAGTLYKGRPAGSLGAAGAFSFNGNKIITTSGGGMLVSPNEEWIAKARHWSQQARDPAPWYQHSELGYNYRMSNVLAGIGRGQLKLLDLRVQQRRAIAFRYRDAFAHVPGISLMPQAPYGLHTNWLSCFLIEEPSFGCSRDTLIRTLDEHGIESRPVWKPMHLQPLYAGCECYGGQVAEDLFRRGICLPSSSSLTPEDQMRIIDAVRAAAAPSAIGQGLPVAIPAGA